MVIEEKYKSIRGLKKGENDLYTWCKEHGEQGEQIIKEWNTLKNGSMSNYKAGSAKKVYWTCSICGNEYIKEIYSRVSGRMHEPCGRKRGIERLKEYHRNKVKETDSLAYKYPELLNEWDYTENSRLGYYPEHMLPGSSRKVNWICDKCGNHYKQYIRLKVQRGYGCKLCKKKNNKIEIEGK